MRFLSLLTVLTLAAPALAQGPGAELVPRARAVAFSADALVTSPGEPETALRAVPDTTSPWRYFPLHVGDQWVYYDFAQGRDYVRGILEDVVHGGRRYFSFYEGHIGPGGGLEALEGFELLLRYDTLTARVYLWNEGNEVVWEPCPFDAPFTGTMNCNPYPYGPATMSGQYGRELIFGSATPPDTLVTSVKTYNLGPSGWFDIRTYAAGIGLIYLADEFREIGIYYARVGGVEYGESPYTTPTAPAPGERGTLSLRVAPNPTRERAVAAYTLDRAGPVSLALYDATGRRVRTAALGVRAAGRHEAALDLAGLAPGLYLARLTGPGGTVGRAVTVEG